MPDSFAALPSWAIIAIFAVIGAAAGGSATYFLRKRYPQAVVLRYLPILAVVAGAALGTLIALPTIRADATPVTCEGAEALAADANAAAPGTRIDDVTTVVDMQVDCAGMTITFRHAVALDIGALTEETWTDAEATISAGRCESPLWRRYMEAGWALVNAYAFQDGGARSITASCEAPLTDAAATTPAP